MESRRDFYSDRANGVDKYKDPRYNPTKKTFCVWRICERILSTGRKITKCKYRVRLDLHKSAHVEKGTVAFTYGSKSIAVTRIIKILHDILEISCISSIG